jgi:hypothetical protein
VLVLVLKLKSSPASSKDTKSATSKGASRVIVVPARADCQSIEFRYRLRLNALDFAPQGLAVCVLIIHAIRLPPSHGFLAIPVIDFWQSF